MAKYLDIFENLKAKIENREYKPGEKLPSIRKIADKFSCNKLTVKKAYDKLKEENYIKQLVGKGSFVKFPDSYKNKGKSLDFSSSYISEKFFPVDKMQQIVDNLFKIERTNLFAQSNLKGIKNFRSTLSNYYNVGKKNMIIISGAQQGLDLISKVFNLKINKNILFEDPTYSGAVTIFKPEKFVKLENDGPDLNDLKNKINKDLKLFYSMPSIHNPTGISYSIEKKLKIAELSKKHDFYIIEDDYLSELLDKRKKRFIDIIPEKTIYIKSLSKITSPGIRLGFMATPDNLINSFLEKKYTSDIVSSTFMQLSLNKFIKNGFLDNHINNIKSILKQRKNQLNNFLNNYDFLEYNQNFNGINIWVKSKINLDIPAPPWASGINFSFSKKFKNFFRLSFMSMDDKSFQDGINYLESIFSNIKNEDRIIY